MWSGFIWLRKWTSSLLLWTQHWTLRLCKMHGISWQADHLLAALEGICCIGLVNRMYLNGICHVPFDISTEWVSGITKAKIEVKKNIKLPASMLGTASYHNFPLLTTILPYLATHWFWSLQQTGVDCISTYTCDMLVLLFSSCKSIQPVVQSHCCQ